MRPDAREAIEERPEWARRQWLVGVGGLVRVESLETLLVVDALRLVVEENGVTVEGDAHLSGIGSVGQGGWRCDHRRGHTMLAGLEDLLTFGAEKDITAERREQWPGLTATPEDAAGDAQAVRLHRAQHAHRAVGVVATEDDDLNQLLAGAIIDGQQALHQRECGARREGVPLVFALVLAIRREAMLLVDRIGVGEIEQGTRRDPDHELVFECLGHATTSCPMVG